MSFFFFLSNFLKHPRGKIPSLHAEAQISGYLAPCYFGDRDISYFYSIKSN